IETFPSLMFRLCTQTFLTASVLVPIFVSAYVPVTGPVSFKLPDVTPIDASPTSVTDPPNVLLPDRLETAPIPLAPASEMVTGTSDGIKQFPENAMLPLSLAPSDV